VFFTLSASPEELAARGTHLIELRWFLIHRCRQRGQLRPPLGVAHVMYGVTFGKLLEMGTKLVFRNSEMFPAL
jgi:hypothetical protein